jgi:hypothetical protein
MPPSVVDQLFEFCLPFAQSQLKKRGGFSPFAAATKPDGTLSPIAFYDEEENLNSETLTAKLAEILTTLALQNEITGSAICYNGVVTVPGKENHTAIIVAMERAPGVAATMAIPYSKRFLRGYKYDPPFRMAADAKIFSSPSSGAHQ